MTPLLPPTFYHYKYSCLYQYFVISYNFFTITKLHSCVSDEDEKQIKYVNVKSHNHRRKIFTDLNKSPDSDKLLKEECTKKKEELKIEDCHEGSKFRTDLNEISASKQLRYFIEGSKNDVIYMIYKMYFPFVLGCGETKLLMDFNEDVLDKSIIERKLDSSIEEVVHMMTGIYFPSILW